MPRKTADNPEARAAAGDFIENVSMDVENAGPILTAFPAVEFETATSKVGGSEIKLRRVVLTGPWEVIE